MACSDFHMPGAFHIEGPAIPRPAFNADVFRAPVADSPSTSVFNRPKSSSSQQKDHPAIPTPASSYAKRRRATPRPSWVASRGSTPFRETHTTLESSISSLSSSTDYFGDAASFLTPRETGRREPNYILAGHIETPGTQEAGHSVLFDDDLGINQLDVDDRRTMGYNSNLSSKRSHCEMERDPFLTQTLSTPTLRTVARLLYTDVTAPGSPNLLPRWPGNGWTAFAVNTPINIIGKCVGKCWEFVKASTFAGFQAGSGDTYPVQPTRTGNRMPRRVPSNNDLSAGLGNPIVFGNIPSELQHQDVLRCEKIRDRDPASSPSRPAVKRRQLSGVPKAAEDLQQWVMVDNTGRSGTLGRRVSEYPTGVIRGPSPSRSNTRSSICQDKRPYPSNDSPLPSNYASSTATSYNRRISVPVSRLASNPISTNTPSKASSPALNNRASSRISHAGSATLTSRQPASYATPRSPATPSTKVPPATNTTPSGLSSGTIRTSPNTYARIKSTDIKNRRQSISLPSPLRTPTNQLDSDSRTVSSASSSSSTCSSASSARGHRRAHSAVTPSSRRRSVIHGVGSAATKEDKAAVDCSSPLISDNSKKILAQRRREDRDTDARMEALNARMQDMIRQAKEALGTTFMVEMDDEEGGEKVHKGASKAVAGAWVDEDDD